MKEKVWVHMRRWILVLVFLLLQLPRARKDGAAKKKLALGPRHLSPDQGDTEAGRTLQAYVVMEASTGKILEGANTHLRWPPASITKLMLALLVMEKLSANEIKLTDTVTASRGASKMEEARFLLKRRSFYSGGMMKACCRISQ